MLIKTLLAMASLLVSFGSLASPLPHLSAFEAVGSGTFRFFGMRIYDATLWSPNGKWDASQPYALELRYARQFDGTAIARRSIEEMRAQRRFSPDTLSKWNQQMRTIFPDVEPGDRLTGVRQPGYGVTFYSDTRKLGDIPDEAFANAFFNIWLHPSTSAPDLRNRLLGAP